MHSRLDCCGQCRPVDSLRLPTRLGQRFALTTLPTALRRGALLTALRSQSVTISTPQSGTSFGANRLDYGNLAEFYFKGSIDPSSDHLVDIILARRGSDGRFEFHKGTGIFRDGIPTPPPADMGDAAAGIGKQALGYLKIGLGTVAVAGGLFTEGMTLEQSTLAVAGGAATFGSGCFNVKNGREQYNEYKAAQNAPQYIQFRLSYYRH